MMLIRSIVRGAWRLVRAIGRAVGRAIRDTAEPAGVAQTMNDEGLSHPSAMGGAMMVGAARRIGAESNRVTDDAAESNEPR